MSSDQTTTILAYLGPEGTFTHQAACRYLQLQPGTPIRLVSYSTIADVLYAVERGEAELGMVPAENSIEGAVNVTQDILAQELNLQIRGELVLDITHYLLSHAASVEQIRTVYGHPQALAQCRHYLAEHLKNADLRENGSSAEAAHLLLHSGADCAAVAPWECHLTYGIPVLVKDIGDYAHNQTRFFLVGRESCPQEGCNKTSLVLAVEKNRPGGLYRVLREFARRRIDLSWIQSRPAKKELGNYLFFLDCEAGGQDPALQETLRVLSARTVYLKVLGSYRRLI